MQKTMLLFALVCFAGAKAQTSLKSQLEHAKFGIIKETVEFLSTDTATFKQVKSHKCKDCSSFDDLKKFAADNYLTNAGKNVIEPLSLVKIDTSRLKWKGSLQQFKQRAHDRITTGGKERRKKMKGYNAYLSSLNAIVNDVVPDGELVQVKDSALKPANDVQVLQPADTTATEMTPAPENNQSPLSSKWISYGIASVFIGLFIYMALRISRIKKRKVDYEGEIKKLKMDTWDKNKQIVTLTGEKEFLEKQLSDVRAELKGLMLRMQPSDNKINQPPAGPEAEAAGTAVPKPDTKPFIQKPKPQAATIKFAKYADMGDGFSIAGLLDQPDDETIFELSTLWNNTGEYKITSNRNAQRHTLSNVQHFLGETCLYDSAPFENATIQTDTPGTIKLNGGKWTIVNPARISFV